MNKRKFESFEPKVQQAIAEAKRHVAERVAATNFSAERAEALAQLKEVNAILDRRDLRPQMNSLRTSLDYVAIYAADKVCRDTLPASPVRTVPKAPRAQKPNDHDDDEDDDEGNDDNNDDSEDSAFTQSRRAHSDLKYDVRLEIETALKIERDAHKAHYTEIDRLCTEAQRKLLRLVATPGMSKPLF